MQPSQSPTHIVRKAFKGGFLSAVTAAEVPTGCNQTYLLLTTGMQLLLALMTGIYYAAAHLRHILLLAA